MAAAPGESSSKHNEIMISEPPTDGISAVCFAPNESDLLLASSWDSVRAGREATRMQNKMSCYEETRVGVVSKQDARYLCFCWNLLPRLH